MLTDVSTEDLKAFKEDCVRGAVDALGLFYYNELDSLNANLNQHSYINSWTIGLKNEPNVWDSIHAICEA